MTKKNFPVLVNTHLEDGLNRVAIATVKGFEKEIFPVLLKTGLLDDKHIEKYLSCDTVEAIYKDALIENPSSIYALEQQEIVENLKEDPKRRVDVWRIFREPSNKARSPIEDGFVFRSIPGFDARNRKGILNAISVKNLKFSIDKEYLRKISIIHPTEEQIDLYNMLLEFCEAYNKKGYHKKYDIPVLFLFSPAGISPCANSILGVTWTQRIK